MTKLSPSVIRAFAAKQTLLWVCQRYDLKTGQEVHDYELPAPAASIRYRKELTTRDKQIAGLYWEAVWIEGAQSPLLDAFRDSTSSHPGTRAPIVLASPSDVDARVPPEEFLPLRILPGVIDPNSPLDAQYGTSRGRVRERTAWGLSAQLHLFRGRVLIVLGARQQSDLNRLFQILEDIPAVELTVLIILPGETVPETPSLPNSTIELWRGSEAEFASALASA